LYQNHFTALTYATAAHAEPSPVGVVVEALRYLLALCLDASIPIVLVALAARPSRAALFDSLFPPTPDRRLIAVIY
jgi:hypothetical protein